ncbi:uncharacterized protein STEHIDRAFT_116397 [Stereum hirsutum FP-91666 SS1]|uniref:Uncharacterized protein n=1 Tax=Stereum hirsutum (strain FP-91666) TaxID=721885 RepID=R7RZF9_STEHR|nr:uncharacterized protein STEHIDRAFT_116397 [Stereum hirsutum FP-91666 SS1]EIM79697.1 hypothetical protein STEHIDRAFT_116397 [Stereum hirsutum FP-91666 SS1]
MSATGDGGVGRDARYKERQEATPAVVNSAAACQDFTWWDLVGLGVEQWTADSESGWNVKYHRGEINNPKMDERMVCEGEELGGAVARSSRRAMLLDSGSR